MPGRVWYTGKKVHWEDGIMTRKLYYENPHLSVFSAQVLSCETGKSGYEITLDATCFYPEGGGQAADTGTLGDVHVTDTCQRGDQVIHICDGPLEVGANVEGHIDYEARFDRMQQHSGEHIVSGIIHRRFGYHNVGFHMGSDFMTIDFDGVIPEEALADIEVEANRAVWQNLPVRCWYPKPEDLCTLPYRTKKALSWPVRIVEIPGYDLCACCGTHVQATGEIGLIKLLNVMGLRGGTRMEMACGSQALKLLNVSYEQNRQVGQAFSAQPFETGEAARRMNDLVSRQKWQITQLQRSLFSQIAEKYENYGNVVHFTQELDSAGVRELADAIAQVCGGIAAVFSGSDAQGYAYCLVTRQGDLRSMGKVFQEALRGRGGGKSTFQQGWVSAAKAEIIAFFRENS